MFVTPLVGLSVGLSDLRNDMSTVKCLLYYMY